MSTFAKAVEKEGITGTPQEAFVRSIFGQESSFGTNTATSNQGAHGAMQILPATFASVADADWDIRNTEHNMRAGIRYALEMLRQAGGDYRLAAMGYYGGPKAIRAGREGTYYSDQKNSNAPNTGEYADQVVARMYDMMGVPTQQQVEDPESFPPSDPYGWSNLSDPINFGHPSLPTLDAGTDIMPSQIPQMVQFDPINAQQIGPSQSAQSANWGQVVEGLRQLAAQDPNAAEVLQGQVPAAQFSLGGREVLAVPSTPEERQFFTGVQSSDYGDQMKDSLIKGYTQVQGARDQLFGQDLFRDQPTDLDSYIREIIERV